MEIVNELFKKNKKQKTLQTNEREYTDLSDIQIMIQYTQRRQGLGFDDIDKKAKFQQPFVKKLKTDQIVKKQEKTKPQLTDKNVEEEGKKAQEKISKNSIKIKKKNFVII